MKQHRNEITLADIATWPEFNSNALAIKDRATFTQRRTALLNKSQVGRQFSELA